jgi:3'-phosphoadenosine 5'-phosphosulfate sulfotransferase (PAPS reductase)/FAD synthetase
MTSIRIPSWLEVDPAHFAVTEPTLAGISGGLTSAVMAALYHAHHGVGAEIRYCFWNTGREAPGTYDFLGKLAECIPMQFYEVRKPAEYGAGPSNMQFEEVEFGQLDKTGKPFEIFLETIKEYRAVVKNEPPIGPNAVQRLCTSYMKAKLSDHVAAALWGKETCWTAAVGLRADEPGRVARMNAHETSTKTIVAPLSQANIVKCTVEAFWKEQDFTLNIAPHQGNCTMCFLKDEADLADIFIHDADPDGNNWEWWKRLDDQFQIRGRDQVRYRQIEAEAPMRMAIRDSLVQIKPLPRSEEWDPNRYQKVLRQEKRIIREGHQRIPCSCESAALMTDEFVLKVEAKQGCLF